MEDFRSLCFDAPVSPDEGVSGREWAGVTGADELCLTTSSLEAKKSAPWSCWAGEDELDALWVVDGDPKNASRLANSELGLALAATGVGSTGLATEVLLLLAYISPIVLIQGIVACGLWDGSCNRHYSPLVPEFHHLPKYLDQVWDLSRPIAYVHTLLLSSRQCCFQMAFYLSSWLPNT